ncbi:MAG: TIM barrel protein, partial [Balneolaceae bacterium]|nr:TIM barrel protein [Balneolaceae bacterium]
WEMNRGGLGPVIERHGIPIVSAFCTANVVDPYKIKEETEKLVRWARILKKHGGKVIEFNADGVDNREDYDYREHKKTIIESMNTYAKAVTDEGLVCALHPHTGTAIESEEEVYFAMENVDTRYMKAGFDSGQLQKGGADYLKIFSDFMPLIEHVHLKDYEGGDNGWLGYCPLGEGKQEVETLLKMLEEGRDEMAGKIMYEQDYDGRTAGRFTNYVSAEISRDYLAKLGYEFKD